MDYVMDYLINEKYKVGNDLSGIIILFVITVSMIIPVFAEHKVMCMLHHHAVFVVDRLVTHVLI